MRNYGTHAMNIQVECTVYILPAPNSTNFNPVAFCSQDQHLDILELMQKVDGKSFKLSGIGKYLVNLHLME